MATIANLTVKTDGSFEGTLATLSVTAPIAIIPNGRKAKDSEPVINTDRRTYHVELRATAASYMASVSKSEEHTSELQSLMRISYAVFCLKKKTIKKTTPSTYSTQTTLKITHT